jgi:hypothetical protein
LLPENSATTRVAFLALCLEITIANNATLNECGTVAGVRIVITVRVAIL